jgi:hypothetical protein
MPVKRRSVIQETRTDPLLKRSVAIVRFGAQHREDRLCGRGIEATTMREPGVPFHGAIFVVCETEFTSPTMAPDINKKNCPQNRVFLEAR